MQAGQVSGLSPLARGNRPDALLPAPAWRSIPARAGEPEAAVHQLEVIKVYPRSRGGTSDHRFRARPRCGLSPLARGNPAGFDVVGVDTGSIPARAGEPINHDDCEDMPPVYPRSRGGTVQTIGPRFHDDGLSPLARGNRLDGVSRLPRIGSIPARAGEPFPTCACSGIGSVYPRSRGGTATYATAMPVVLGLSPLARGNQPWGM